MGGMECSFLYSPSKNGAWIESLQSQSGMLNNSAVYYVCEEMSECGLQWNFSDICMKYHECFFEAFPKVKSKF